MTRISVDDLTAEQIRNARAASLIDRATYEAALYCDPEARERVFAAINDRNLRRFIEEVTP